MTVSKRRKLIGSVLGLVLAVGLVEAANTFIVTQPIATAIGDQTTQGFKLSAHFAYYVNPVVLVLDLNAADSTQPEILFRSVLQAAQAMHEAYRPFRRVILARSGSAVYTLDGEYFDSLGKWYAAGQPRMLTILHLPGKLRTPDGAPAYPQYRGSSSMIFQAQHDDAISASRRWAEGRDK